VKLLTQKVANLLNSKKSEIDKLQAPSDKLIKAMELVQDAGLGVGVIEGGTVRFKGSEGVDFIIQPGNVLRGIYEVILVDKKPEEAVVESAAINNSTSEEAIKYMSEILMRLVCLYSLLKQKHWNSKIQGEHLGYDAAADEIYETIDEFAEEYFMARNIPTPNTVEFGNILASGEPEDRTKELYKLINTAATKEGLLDPSMQSLVTGVGEEVSHAMGFIRLAENGVTPEAVSEMTASAAITPAMTAVGGQRMEIDVKADKKKKVEESASDRSNVKEMISEAIDWIEDANENLDKIKEVSKSEPDLVKIYRASNLPSILKSCARMAKDYRKSVEGL